MTAISKATQSTVHNAKLSKNIEEAPQQQQYENTTKMEIIT